jgi:hypothetical protein
MGRQVVGGKPSNPSWPQMADRRFRGGMGDVGVGTVTPAAGCYDMPGGMGKQPDKKHTLPSCVPYPPSVPGGVVTNSVAPVPNMLAGPLCCVLCVTQCTAKWQTVGGVTGGVLGRGRVMHCRRCDLCSFSLHVSRTGVLCVCAKLQ